MNNKRAKEIRTKVLQGLGYEPNEQESIKDIVKYPEFKKIFRAAKKISNLNRNTQSPRLPSHTAIKGSKILLPIPKKRKDQSKRNLVLQVASNPDGSVNKIFHQKPFRYGDFKSWWDQLNRTKRKNNVFAA